MDKAEMKAFWSLLSGLRPLNSEYLGNKDVQRAWALALKPYSYQAAKEALLTCCREVNFWPLVSEVVSRIPEDQRPPQPPAQSNRSRNDRMLRDLERLKTSLAEGNPQAAHHLPFEARKEEAK